MSSTGPAASPSIAPHDPQSSQSAIASPRSIDIKLCALLFAAAFVCYANSFGNPFLWDHEGVIVNNPLIRSLRNIPQAFTTDLFGRPLAATSYYRPFGVITYMLDYHLWGLHPAGFHLTSILLHTAAGILLFFLFRKLSVPLSVNFLICLFFVIHPINTETVTYLFREESLGVIFSALCFLSYLKVREGSSAGFGVAAAALFVLALLSKETSVVLPFILAAESALWGRSKMADERSLRASRYVILALVAVSAAYIGIRQHLISSSGLFFLSTIRYATPWQRILTLPRILVTYIGLVIFPRHLHMEYLFVTQKASDRFFWLDLVAICAGGAAVIWHLRRCASEKSYQKHMVFFASWFLLGLAPFTHVLVPLQATVREHWAYFAEIGLLGAAVSLGYFLYCRFPDRRVRAALLVLVVGMLGYDATTTVLRNRDWSDPLRLYQHDLQFEPRSFLLHTNLGLLYLHEGKLDDAKREYLQAIEVSPGHRYEVAYNNLGVLYERQGRDDLAESAFRKSITLGDYETAYANLAFLYLKTHHLPEATAVAEDGVHFHPLNTELHYYLGVAYLAQDRYAEAKRELVATERLSPGYEKVRELLQLIAVRTGS